jgi:hypothetical protein
MVDKREIIFWEQIVPEKRKRRTKMASIVICSMIVTVIKGHTI